MKYKIIYADPAWPFKNKNTGGSMKSGASSHYKTPSLNDLKNLDIQSIAEDDCILFMWWVNSQPQEALDLAKAWGFTVKNMNGFVWVKLTAKLKLWFGMGFWTRAVSESMLIAVKGKPKRVSASVRSLIKTGEIMEALNTKHSKKPDVFADKIVELCGDVSRVELFARDRKEGWSCWGDEVESDVELKIK